MDESTYDIQELIDLSGISRRNIYFYVQQGVLPAPQGAGLAARYGEEHLLRLRLIPILRQDGLRLDQIRQKFDQIELVTLRRLLAEKATAFSTMPAPAAVPARQITLSQPRIVPQMEPATAASRAVPCQRYDLPGGLILIVPNHISAEDRLRLERILAAAGIDFPDSELK